MSIYTTENDVYVFFSAQDMDIMVSFWDPKFSHLFVSDKQSWFALEFLCAAQSQIDVVKYTTNSSRIEQYHLFHNKSYALEQ